MGSAGVSASARPIVIEDLGERLRITLNNSNLLTDSIAGMGLAFEGDSTISKWAGN